MYGTDVENDITAPAVRAHCRLAQWLYNCVACIKSPTTGQTVCETQAVAQTVW